MKKIIMMLFLCFVMLSPAEAAWKECDFPNVLKFAYPDTLKVQNDTYETVKTTLNSYQPNTPAILDLNFSPVDHNDKSCFVTIRVSLGRKISTSINEPVQIKADRLIKLQGSVLENASNSLGVQIDLVNPAEIFSFDDKYCIYMEYHYKLGNEQWYTYIYNFDDYDKRYRITINVRSDKYNEWTAKPNDIRDIVKTLQPVR